MIKAEKAVIIKVVVYCINRIRQEKDDYAAAADDVAYQLQFLADWIRESTEGARVCPICEDGAYKAEPSNLPAPDCPMCGRKS